MANPPTGTTPAQVVVSINPTGLVPGMYMGRLSIGTANVTVTLTITAAPGSLGVITTVAGTDWSLPSTSFPDGNAPLGFTNGVAVDAQGNIYFVDQSDSVVFRQSPDGTMRVIAGNGIVGFSGDGGPAANASLYLTVHQNFDYYNAGGGIAIDGTGNVYIADTWGSTVRRISPDGIITTVAGNGRYDFLGDQGPAAKASLDLPTAIAVDRAGNLYISDTDNDRVRKVTRDGVITTFAGGGDKASLGDNGPATKASLDKPLGLAFDAKGNLFIADYQHGLIRRVSPDGIITSVAGSGTNRGYLIGDNGSATKAQLFYPTGVAIDALGNLYIADSYNHAVRKVTVADGIIRTVW